MGSVSQAVQNPARRALSHGALNTMEGADDDRPLSTRVLTGADSPSSGMLHLTLDDSHSFLLDGAQQGAVATASSPLPASSPLQTMSLAKDIVARDDHPLRSPPTDDTEAALPGVDDSPLMPSGDPLMLGKSSLFEPVDRIVQSSQSAPNSPANSRKNKLQRCSICGAPPCPPPPSPPPPPPTPPPPLSPRVPHRLPPPSLASRHARAQVAHLRQGGHRIPGARPHRPLGRPHGVGWQ
jgi:hypothetical protein